MIFRPTLESLRPRLRSFGPTEFFPLSFFTESHTLLHVKQRPDKDEMLWTKEKWKHQRVDAMPRKETDGDATVKLIEEKNERVSITSSRAEGKIMEGNVRIFEFIASPYIH